MIIIITETHNSLVLQRKPFVFELFFSVWQIRHVKSYHKCMFFYEELMIAYMFRSPAEV